MKKAILTILTVATLALGFTGCQNADASNAPVGEPYKAYSSKYTYCANFGVGLYQTCLEDMEKRKLFN